MVWVVTAGPAATGGERVLTGLAAAAAMAEWAVMAARREMAVTAATAAAALADNPLGPRDPEARVVRACPARHLARQDLMEVALRAAHAAPMLAHHWPRQPAAGHRAATDQR